MRRVALIAVVLVVLAGLFLVVRSQLDGGPGVAQNVQVRVQGGKMTPAEVTIGERDMVTMTITSDKTINFHLHGYDLQRTVTPGSPVTLTFDANLTGSFEIEDEEAQTELGTLIVQPRGLR